MFQCSLRTTRWPSVCILPALPIGLLCCLFWVLTRQPSQLQLLHGSADRASRIRLYLPGNASGQATVVFELAAVQAARFEHFKSLGGHCDWQSSESRGQAGRGR
jgi:hypothetical protein